MVKSKVRLPAKAGQFYEASTQSLTRQIEPLIDKGARKRDVVACILPHAGYIYSGRVAGNTISRVNIKDKIILLGPNHTGYGPNISIMTEGTWQTPLGDVAIDCRLAKEILSHSKYLTADADAHADEHSLEVELPFLQYLKKDFEIVPIVFFPEEITVLKEVGRAIAKAIAGLNLKDSTLLISSSDMTHFESQEQAVKKDREAIEAILKLDEETLMNTVERLDISMCGYAPTIAMLAAAKLLGAKTAELIQYQTSGDVTGDKSSVVGYAGIIIY